MSELVTILKRNFLNGFIRLFKIVEESVFTKNIAISSENKRERQGRDEDSSVWFSH